MQRDPTEVERAERFVELVDRDSEAKGQDSGPVLEQDESEAEE